MKPSPSEKSEPRPTYSIRKKKPETKKASSQLVGTQRNKPSDTRLIQSQLPQTLDPLEQMLMIAISKRSERLASEHEQRKKDRILKREREERKAKYSQELFNFTTRVINSPVKKEVQTSPSPFQKLVSPSTEQVKSETSSTPLYSPKELDTQPFVVKIKILSDDRHQVKLEALRPQVVLIDDPDAPLQLAAYSDELQEDFSWPEEEYGSEEIEQPGQEAPAIVDALSLVEIDLFYLHQEVSPFFQVHKLQETEAEAQRAEFKEEEDLAAQYWKNLSFPDQIQDLLTQDSEPSEADRSLTPQLPIAVLKVWANGLMKLSNPEIKRLVRWAVQKHRKIVELDEQKELRIYPNSLTLADLKEMQSELGLSFSLPEQ